MSEKAYSPYSDSPGLVKTIAVLTLVNGITNIFWGLIATAIVVPTIILACLAVFTILPTILGVFEIIYALKLLSNPPQPVQPSNTIAILEVLCFLTGNVFSMIVGILSLVFYNDPQVRDYFARLNGIPTPAIPAHPSTPELAPVFEADIPAEKPAPETEPKPAPKPKKPSAPKIAAENSNGNSEVEAGSKPAKPKRKTKSGDSSS